MKREITAETDLECLAEEWSSASDHKGNHCNVRPPKILSAKDLLALKFAESKMLVENLLPGRGACLLVGPPKSGKTLVAVQVGIAVASGTPFLGYYPVLDHGPTLIIERDDPAGDESISTILRRSSVAVDEIPFKFAPRAPFTFGPALIEWLAREIQKLGLRLVILDSYTALRSSRKAGIDIVKSEQMDLTTLGELAKRTNCTILIIHHASKGAAGMDWSDQAAGTFAMSAATEAQIHISRFKDLDGNAPELRRGLTSSTEPFESC